MRKILTTTALAVPVLMANCAANAQTAATQPSEPPETVTISASLIRSLEQFTPTGSRLDLSVRETPATLDVIDADTIIGRGFSTVEMAADSLPGVVSGGSPGDLASFAMRGFSDDQITILHNGLYLGPSDMVNRPANSFNLQNVEVLKGPASVLYGQGAIGGVVNVVNKAPSFGTPSLEALITVGSFGTVNVGVGGSTHFGDTLAIRGDISRNSTEGFVHHTHSDSLNGTVSFLWKPVSNFELQVSLDYLQDNPSPYWGTPLVTTGFATQAISGIVDSASGLAIDKRTRYVNYNVADYEIHSQQYWPTVFGKWQINEHLTFENYTYYFWADRKWIDSESYTFNSVTNLVDRDRFFVFHRQETYGDQGSVTYRDDLFGMANTLVVGFDYSHLNFTRSRGFPDGDSVDPFNPSPGLFGPIVPRVSPTRWNDFAGFFENSIDLAPALKLITGARIDEFDLVRKNYDASGTLQPATGFTRSFNPVTWRAGLVYNLTQDITPYVSWTTGQDPAGSNVMLVNAGENFDLSKSHQLEGGVKATLMGGRADVTIAGYDITRKNFLTQTGPSTVSPVGSQKSHGFEVSGDIKLLDNWNVSANAAYTDTSYGTFIDTNTGIDDSGNRPANIPKWTANLWTSFTDVGGLPLELGGCLRYIGERFGNNANTYKLMDYTLVNLYAAYRLTPAVMLTARVNNVFDKAYAQWADIFYPSQLILGAPRSYEVGIVGRF